jgi:hypothetical protein
MRTYFWISLFAFYRITANYLIEFNVILSDNKEFKKESYITVYVMGTQKANGVANGVPNGHGPKHTERRRVSETVIYDVRMIC